MEEKILVGKETPYPLEGILILPENSPSPSPAVVLVHGSGPLDRDETVGANTPFKDIAEYLAKNGVAAIRYDKRTKIYGKQMIKTHPEEITVKEETIEDALLAAEMLRDDVRIDAEKIFLLGHSLGGMLAPRIADRGNFAGIIILAGSPRTLREIMIDQNMTLLEELGKPLRFIASKQIAKFQKKFNTVPELSEEEAKKTKILGKTYAWYFKEMENHPAEGYLRSCETPLLILQGKEDFQVSAEKDFALYQKLCEAKPEVTMKLYEGLNHLFMPSRFGKIKKARKEYNIPQKVTDEVLKDIASWITSHS